MVVRALLQWRKQNLTQSSTFSDAAYLLTPFSNTVFYPWGTQITFKRVFLINIFCLKPWLSVANTKQSTMPVPCQPCRAVPEARVKVILMGVFLPSLAGSAGSYNPGRASCQAWAHTAMGSLSKKGKKGCHNASFHTSICHRTVAVPHRQQCSANVSTEKRPRQKATGT